MTQRISEHEYFLRMAELASQRSTCLRRSVGCVLVNKRGHVLATGRNGVASGLHHCNEVTRSVPWSRLTTPISPFRFSHEVREDFGDNEELVDVYDHACPGAAEKSGKGLDSCKAIHAEQNALLQCHNVHDIYKVYVTVSPCITCTKLLLNTSAEYIIARRAYSHDVEARQLWESSRGLNSWIIDIYGGD